MTAIRAFVPEDIPRVADLHRRAFGITESMPASEADDHFRDVFFENPWRDPEVNSLVYQGPDGRIDAFLGVIPRPMLLGGRRCRAVIATQLMVDPALPRSFAPLALLKHLFASPYDLVLTDSATEAVRQIWTRLGGEAVWLQSMAWVRPIRPSRYVTSLLEERRPASGPLVAMTRPVTALTDALMTRVRPNRFQRAVPGLEEGDLTVADIVAGSRQCLPGFELRPDHDERSLGWVLREMERKRRHGRLERVSVRAPGGEIVGWYVYYLSTSRPCEVCQVGAAPGYEIPVLSHLFRHAWQRGAIAVTGRVEGRLMMALGALHCPLSRTGPWFLIHTRDTGLSALVHRGAAQLTRFDVSYWMRFIGG